MRTVARTSGFPNSRGASIRKVCRLLAVNHRPEALCHFLGNAVTITQSIANFYANDGNGRGGNSGTGTVFVEAERTHLGKSRARRLNR